MTARTRKKPTARIAARARAQEPVEPAPDTAPSGRGVVIEGHEPHVEVRIEQAAALMRAGRFVKGRTVYQLAKEWGIGDDAAKRHTAEASRRVRAEVEDWAKTEATSWLVGNAQQIVADSLAAAAKQKTSRNGADHRRVALQAMEHLRAVTGAGAPMRVELAAQAAAGPDPSKLSPDEARLHFTLMAKAARTDDDRRKYLELLEAIVQVVPR